MPPPSADAFRALAFPTQDWRAVHSPSLALGADGASLVVSDGPMEDWQLIRVRAPELVGTVRVSCEVTFLPGGEAEFYVNHWGGVNVCSVGRDGEVLRDAALSVGVMPLGPDTLRVEVEFESGHDSLSLGTSREGRGIYAGSGRPQLALRALAVSVAPRAAVHEADVIALVDVGAMGGLQPRWMPLRGRVRPILFEPSPESFRALAESLGRAREPGPAPVLVDRALWNADGTQRLFLTRHPGCTSLLEPDADRLARFRVAPAFDVVGTAEVECARYDALFAAGRVPVPDVVKIDVQGGEHQVLEGFGDLLHRVLGVELEAHLYPIYKGQRLLGDLVALLDRHGLAARRLEEQRSFDTDAVEFNVYFTRRDRNGLDEAALGKLAVVERLWGLSDSWGGAEVARAALAMNP